ncbi:metallophosphoesterase [Bradyrhizobium sp. WSM2254]|uniref:metallophosphoesterase family protein n=1 Tax=Bradyrhizobium sp. WSM2254 TaxID=1188263 RepID=UPI000A0386BE|nr:metallophosphoesterase [Bradyrhizobium sp. WSM2254]
MGRHYIIQISDLHLSESRAYNQVGWEACLRYIANDEPELVICTGDHVLDDPDVEDDHEFAFRQLSRLRTPFVALPGNHDIGDCNPAPYLGQHVNRIRLARYRRIFGPDWWSREVGDWRLLGLNSMLLGSGLAEEQAQRSWMLETIQTENSRPTAVFLHKPLFVEQRAEPDVPDICVTAYGRDRLLKDLDGVNLRLVASGHNHHYRTLMVDGVQFVWAPSTAQILRIPRAFRALMIPGLVRYWLDDNGSIEFGLEQPPGMEASDITDMLDRYHAMRSAPLLPWQAGQIPLRSTGVNIAIGQ